MLTVETMVSRYNAAFPKYDPLHVFNNRISGVWIMGQDYRVKSGYYGGYPAGYLKRIRSMFVSFLSLWFGGAE